MLDGRTEGRRSVRAHVVTNKDCLRGRWKWVLRKERWDYLAIKHKKEQNITAGKGKHGSGVVVGQSASV